MNASSSEDRGNIRESSRSSEVDAVLDILADSEDYYRNRHEPILIKENPNPVNKTKFAAQNLLGKNPSKHEVDRDDEDGEDVEEAKDAEDA